MTRASTLLAHWAGLCGLAATGGALAEALPEGARVEFQKQGPQAVLTLPRLPAMQQMTVERTPDLGAPFVGAPGALSDGYTWTGQAEDPTGFFRVRLQPLGPTNLLAAVALNRLAYGPTPDLLERVLTGPSAIGPAAYLAEQLTPESISENLDAPVPTLDWQQVTLTGVASSSVLYIYPSAVGEVYLDDLTLVAGNLAGQGANLVTNGGFELPLAGTWTVSTNLIGSEIATAVKRSGESCLRLVSTSGGSTRNSAIWQQIVPALRIGQPYTLSYWYLPSTNGANLTVRLSSSADYPGQGIDTTHSLVPGRYLPGLVFARLQAGLGTIDDLRAWHALHAVRSERQLLQTLLQFTDNHFVTQYTKSRDYVDGLVTNTSLPGLVAAGFEFRELSRWRDVLLNPNGTFYDLLKISAESPAMIIYLDTVTSSGGNANENYSRELLELFTFGVDNGYDQGDIEEMSRAWTGWRVDKLPPDQADNPFAARVENRDLDPGVWMLRFRTDRHDTKAKTIFKGKHVADRFGPPWAGASYELNLAARTNTAGMQDGYDLLKHLANQPYTQEYISVKLCRLLVHERFVHGVYDYTDPGLSDEAGLIKACMQAWETPGSDGRKGNLRQVLATIFSSELFRTRAALSQKVKTPFEYVVSTIRALRAAKPTGGWTADTDGYDMIATLRRLNMNRFERGDPDGWSEFGRDWVSTAALVERMRYAQNFLIAPREPLKAVDFGSTGDDNVSDPVALLQLKLPGDQWRNPEHVVDFFLDLLFPGEGRANLAGDRSAGIAFLETDSSGGAGSPPFATLDPGSRTYDGRVRGLVAFLMGLPRFQEQ